MLKDSTIVVLLIVVFIFSVKGFCEKYTPSKPLPKDYVRAIVGEAANQSEDTMVCIAHALRNRGNLKGVYGYTAKHVWTESDATWGKAWEAWTISGQEPDTLHGAKNFGSLADLGDNFKAKALCGDFYFY
jgi:hypothetical protein